jgi:serine-type D-Ala-D-Ala carboxypeptidase (penicillin-binding protein 5/6)
MKMKICLILAICLFFSGFTYQPKEKSKNVNLDSIAGVVIDQDSGRILYSKNGNKVLAMASTTKIITCIVAIEKGNLNDIVVVSERAASVRGSSAGLKPGEKIKLEELLYGLMLRSGNDAAIAIAEHLGGNVEGFIKLMNEKALELGALNTSFATPHGLDAQEHFTTAEDLAKITAYAMKNEFFAKIASTKSISSGVSGAFNREYGNINKFIYRMENADGVKTGYTGNAGKCLVASVKHTYGRYICVVLNSGDRWKDAEKLAKFANDNYKFIKVFDKDESVNRLRVYGGDQKYITGKIDKELYLPVKEEEMQKVKMDVYVPSVIFSPVSENETIGNVVAQINDVVVAKYPLKSDREIKRKNYIDVLKEMMSYLY